MKRSLIWVWLPLVWHGQTNGLPDNRLSKIYHHRIGSQGKRVPVPEQIDLGKVVFYFKQQPRIEVVRNRAVSDHEHEMVFLFPQTTFDGEANDLLAQFNKEQQPWYKVRLEFERGRGVVFSITYDPEQVNLAYETFMAIKKFDAVNFYKGVIFRFYNTRLIGQLRNRSDGMLRMASAKKPSVVLDFGHGGRDEGARSVWNQLMEKDVTMQVGFQVASLLKGHGYDVFLTRDRDCTVALDQRTTFANTCPHADVFISLHANGSTTTTKQGIETYCLRTDLFTPCLCQLDAHGKKLQKQMMYRLCQNSQDLASCVHNNLYTSVKKNYSNVKDGGIKNAVSQVLVGPTMPTVLIEMGYLSHPQESKNLGDKQYQTRIAQGICNGIEVYFKNMRTS